MEGDDGRDRGQGDQLLDGAVPPCPVVGVGGGGVGTATLKSVDSWSREPTAQHRTEPYGDNVQYDDVTGTCSTG